MNKESQALRILALLRSREWVTLPEIMDLRIASHTRRIHELRKAGHNIEMEIERVGTARHSKYRLVR